MRNEHSEKHWRGLLSRVLWCSLGLLSFAASAEVPWPVGDSACSSVSVVVCDDLAWVIVPLNGGPPVIRGLGGAVVSATVLVPAGEYSYIGSTNWTVNLQAGSAVYLGIDTRGNLRMYDDASQDRKVVRLQMVCYGFSFYTCLWVGGLMLRMLPRQPNVGDV